MRRRKRGFLRKLIKMGLYLTALLLIIGLSVLAASYLLGPPPMATEQNTTIYSKDDEVISMERGIENRHWLGLEEMSDKVIETTILIEDQHFYDHYGFDLKRIVGAIWTNINSASLSEGASTISQQLARNLYLTHEKTWVRKLKEAFYTIQLEMHYTKDEILEAYLNTIYYGHGAYGIGAASNFFFGKSQADLSYAEVAMLVGIPKGPTYYSPFNNEANAEARKETILYHLWQGSYIDDATYYAALQEELEYVTGEESSEEEFAGHFRDLAVSEAAAILEVPEQTVRAGGYQIYTTLDANLQREIEETVHDVIPESTELEAAVMLTDIHTGEIIGLLGGRDYRKSEFNRAVHALRMPGSSFKPFLYYEALENGYTALTELESKPTTFTLDDGGVYEPQNFNHQYAHEPITLAQAIALSDNVYAVRTQLYVGVDRVIETARKFGFEGDIPAVPSLALGSLSVTIEELISAYAMLGNGGMAVPSYTIEKIVDQENKTVYEKEANTGEHVLDEETSFILTHLLSGVFDPKLNGYMPVTGSTISHQLSRLYAGKSGTTNADHWMAGYSPSTALAVWTGYDDHREIESREEATYAKEIWAQVMEAAHEEGTEEQFPIPDGIVGVPIDLETGLRATPDCGHHRMMYFKEGTEPHDYCAPNQDTREPEDNNGLFRKWFQLFFE